MMIGLWIVIASTLSTVTGVTQDLREGPWEKWAGEARLVVVLQRAADQRQAADASWPLWEAVLEAERGGKVETVGTFAAVSGAAGELRVLDADVRGKTAVVIYRLNGVVSVVVWEKAANGWNRLEITPRLDPSTQPSPYLAGAEAVWALPHPIAACDRATVLNCTDHSVRFQTFIGERSTLYIVE